MNIRRWLGIESPTVRVDTLAEIEKRRIARIMEGAGFREYERPEGMRGTATLPEYRVTDFWDGREVDEGFTFSRERAEDMMSGAIEQLYDVELHTRTDGDWELLERRHAEDT